MIKRWNFELYTMKYLGTREYGEIVLNAVSRFPRKFKPTKIEIIPSFTKKLISDCSRDEILTLFEAEAIPSHSIGITFYKVQNKLEFTANWDKWDMSDGKLPYNGIGFCTNDIQSFDKKSFQAFYEIWLLLCEQCHAEWGYIYGIESYNVRPRGQGYCLPRLHYITYFGEKYCTAFKLKDKTIPNVEIEYLDNGAATLTFQADPAQLIEPNDLEKQAINILGSEYFWNEKDNRRSPKFKYRLPDFDLSEVLIDFIEYEES